MALSVVFMQQLRLTWLDAFFIALFAKPNLLEFGYLLSDP
jgi:hypothetical protein